jgi:hypothetical protein
MPTRMRFRMTSEEDCQQRIRNFFGLENCFLSSLFICIFFIIGMKAIGIMNDYVLIIGLASPVIFLSIIFRRCFSY